MSGPRPFTWSLWGIRRMVTSVVSPPCSRCQKTDRMRRLPDTPTDFGGMVNVWVCRRCGIVAIETHGERPGSSRYLRAAARAVCPSRLHG